MRTLDTNDWIFLNSIIYKIYTMNNIDEMREQFLEQMKMLIDYDSADFLLASPDGENKLVIVTSVIVTIVMRKKTNAIIMAII